MQPLTPDDVRLALDAANLGLTIRHFDDSTATSELAAEAIGCVVGQIAKSICILVDGVPILVVASGDQQVDDRKIATMFEVGRKKVKLAKPDQCIEIYGYAPGGVPPVGHRTPNIPIYLDQTLKRYETVYAAAGSPNDNFGMTIEQLETLTGGTWADVSKA
ncbi:YbaK/EbsC family protein [Phototrophicus methaneseepsis]|uniref:YbaK/EbsC family protein n=1 Tax=Phototrophicus methaneseepsis TaxID=2710758 RepID=A0A7S8ED42_9CHLR|nr:YbaK/EbsC family protein [Phototrophicus methaneseepsis]QPC84772.1 YbaK/EbsC family protein [Phototrophicus methaneseepsis]